ncbi:L-2,3-butanediol dehydrogenase [Cytospora mali]|uniref:L-2,3-butanediol dehydrogenase n=1 Tax=Cytospora mali TaxID=578113 RepID=A0A194VX98_CYTMA|nr:L-2,3-butanediol dehydrogenase [Valsa mali]
MNFLTRSEPIAKVVSRRILQRTHQIRCASKSAPPSLLRQSVEGKNAIVTGSSQGIGKSIALRLASDGYNVCINDIPAKEKDCGEVVKEIKSMGRKACTATADVTKRNEVKDMIQKSVKELGPLHAMVANAGIAQMMPLLDLTEEDFARMFAVNVHGVQNCYAEAAHQMISQGTCKRDSPGKLLATASIVAFKPLPFLSHYSASKWAVRGLTQGYAMELAEHNITVNAFAPGIVGTAIWDLIDEGLAKKSGRKDVRKGDIMREYVQDRTALGRIGLPEDVAKLVSFLCSSDSNFITGQTQVVDGGIVFT